MGLCIFGRMLRKIVICVRSTKEAICRDERDYYEDDEDEEDEEEE